MDTPDTTPTLTLAPYTYEPYTRLSEAEQLRILSWRNHPSIRKWMFNPEPITPEDHLRFIEGLAHRDDALYWLVKKDNHPVGCINLIHLNPERSSAEIGYFLAPEQLGNQLGLDFLYHALALAFNVLNLALVEINVMVENKAAYQLNTFLGFEYQKTYTDTINGKPVTFSYGELTRAQFHTDSDRKTDREAYKRYRNNENRPCN